LNPHIDRLEPSLIRSINARKRPGDIDLGLGEPTLAPDLAAFEAALEWTRSHGSPYSPNAGFAELRASIAAYVGGQGWATGAPTEQQVCVTIGSEEAIYLAIKSVVDPAVDEVLIVEPCYLAYAKICVLEGIRHRLVPLDPSDGFKPSAAKVLEMLRPETRLLIINTPSNPTGRIWPTEELIALSTGLAATGRGDVFVLSDEVYRELHYGWEVPGSLAAHYPATLIAGSLSKSNAMTGLRLGWLAGPPEVIERAVRVHQLVNTAASTFSQRVALEVLGDTTRLTTHRNSYLSSREALRTAVNAARLDWIPPEGAFYALVKLPPNFARDSVVAAERILEEQRIVTVPGRAFGDSAEGWLRLSWVAPIELLTEGVGRLKEWFRANSD
jgi:aminotransferase